MLASIMIVNATVYSTKCRYTKQFITLPNKLRRAVKTENKKMNCANHNKRILINKYNKTCQHECSLHCVSLLSNLTYLAYMFYI